MNGFLWLLVAYGMCFGFKENKAPFGIKARFEAIPLFKNEKGETFGTRMLKCAYCLGFHCGWITGLMHMGVKFAGATTAAPYLPLADVALLLPWSFACAAFCFSFDEAVGAIERSWPEED